MCKWPLFGAFQCNFVYENQFTGCGDTSWMKFVVVQILLIPMLNSVELINSTLLFSTIELCQVLSSIPILLIICITTAILFSFLANLLDTFIRVSDYLNTLIHWLHQHCSAKLEYALLVFRISIIFINIYSILLET